ncbi:hypothetical protein ACXWP3_09755, partial [Streptococcus pyogenes]
LQSLKSSGHDFIYFSNVTGSGDEPTETGSLQFSDDAWTNSFHLGSAEADALGLEATLSPSDAKAPATLLPASTLAYGVA